MFFFRILQKKDSYPKFGKADFFLNPIYCFEHDIINRKTDKKRFEAF